VTEQRLDGRVERGNRTRRLVLRHTVAIASSEGLDSLSLGRLSTELKLSKSGVFALFGSKEELQLATIRAASRIYLDTVVTPALAHPPGLHRIWQLSEAWLGYSSRRVFPGGCFFQKVMAEYGSRPAPVQDAQRTADTEWRALVRQTITEARDAGELASDVDADQLAFELISFWEAANIQSVLLDSALPYARARTAVRNVLRTASTTAADFLATPAAG
jgi:AcrR family transcriptional regulator